jgi:hypothetical protein
VTATITAPAPSRTNVEQRAVAWLADRRSYLDPANGEDSTALFARKAIVEVALLVGMRARLDPRPLGDDYSALLETIASIAGRWSYRDLVRRDRRALLLYAGTCAALRLCGREDADLRHGIEAAVRGRYATSFERVPYRHLDLVHTLELAGIDWPGPGLETAIPLTLLAADPNALELSTSDTYAITHAIFYATDFGQRAIAGPTGQVVALLEECLVMALGASDADLVGELLMCLTCMRAAPSAVAQAARGWLQAWQEPDGRLEGPAGVIPQRLTDADPAWGSWATAYHTTIVAALDDLLLRTTPSEALPGEDDRRCDPAGLPAASAPGWQAAIDSAAIWLDSAAAPGDLRSRVWAGEALLAAGSPQRARAALAPAIREWGRRPEVGAVTLHLAALAARLGVATPAMQMMLEHADLTLRSAPEEATDLDAARSLLAGARGRAHRSTVRIDAAADAAAQRRPTDVAASARGPQVDAHAELRARSLGLVADLLLRGPAPVMRADPAAPAVLLLARAARCAVADYDPGWLAAVCRGLTRLPGAPDRLIRDALDLLVGQQARSGAIGAPLADDPDERGRLQLEWTTLALPALLEGAGRLGSPPAASTPDEGDPGAG